MQDTYTETGFVRLCFEKSFWLIIINIVFLICCIPLFTIPAAITALCTACQKLLSDDPGVLESFFRALRRGFFSAFPLGLIFVVGSLLSLGFSVLCFRVSEGRGLTLVLSVFFLVCVYVLYCMGSFAFQISARVELRVTAVLRNAFFLTFGRPRIFFGRLALSFASFAAGILLFPYSFPWIVLLGASFPCFAAARGILPLVDRLIVKE